jgi:hypothetical protein
MIDSDEAARRQRSRVAVTASLAKLARSRGSPFGAATTMGVRGRGAATTAGSIVTGASRVGN